MQGDLERAWRQHYEWRARQYASEAQAAAYSDAGFAARMQALSSLLQRLPLSGTPRTLDVGCATGAYARALTRAGHRVIGVDYAQAQLVRARAADAGRPYLAADGYALPFRTGIFDLVISMGVLQLVAEPARLIAEATRVLRPEGVLLVEALNGASLIVRALHARDVLRGRALSHALHRPDAVQRCFVEAGLAGVGCQGLYLVPARARRLQRWVERAAVGAALDRWPVVGHRLATAMFFVGQKAATPRDGGADAPGPYAHRTRPPSVRAS